MKGALTRRFYSSAVAERGRPQVGPVLAFGTDDMSEYFFNPLTPAPFQFSRELSPLMSTIWVQGNSAGTIERGDMRDSRQSVTFVGPFDFAALRAVYEFPDSVRLIDSGGGGSRIDFTLPSGEEVMTISSAGIRRAGYARRNRRWWKRWNAGPGQRVFFDNPYSPRWEGLVQSGRRVLASESVRAALFPLLAAEAARGNFGWLVPRQPDRFQFNHRLDLTALRSEFDFGPGIQLEDETNTITFDGNDGIAFRMVGKRGQGTSLSVGMRARWWGSRGSQPAEPRVFLNPWEDVG